MMCVSSEPRSVTIKQEPRHDGVAEVQAPVFNAPWVGQAPFASQHLQAPFVDLAFGDDDIDDDGDSDDAMPLWSATRPRAGNMSELDALVCEEEPGMTSPVATSDVERIHRRAAEHPALAKPVSPSWSAARLQDTMADRCAIHGCAEPAEHGDRCKRHVGARLCKAPGCTKNTQSNGLCIRHGGGRRCEVEGCPRGAQARGKCKTHGGGVRCKAPGCERSSQGSGLCRTHGGGKLCDFPGCKKGTQRHGKCSTHGGARRCRVAGCEKVDRGGGVCGRHKAESTASPTPTARSSDLTTEPVEKAAIV